MHNHQNLLRPTSKAAGPSLSAWVIVNVSKPQVQQNKLHIYKAVPHFKTHSQPQTTLANSVHNIRVKNKASIHIVTDNIQ